MALGRAALDEADVQSDPIRAALIQERLATYFWGAGDSDAALRSARAAVELLPSDPPTAHLARALCGEGRMLVMRSRNEEARRCCEKALVVARTVGRDATVLAGQLGHQPLSRELQALARRARIRATDTTDTSAPDHQYRELGLSPHEVEVLQLLAEGHTNRQIAAQLYITEKTAEHHVSRILNKLGVRTRGAAGAIAHRIS